MMNTALKRNVSREALIDSVCKPRQTSVYTIIAETARNAPQTIAVMSGSSRLTYAGLLRRASQIAARLSAAGTGTDSIVGICMAPSPNLFATMLAVLKTGGAYLPLDPGYPPERLRFMLRDSGAVIVVTDEETQDRLPITSTPVLLVSDNSFREPQRGVNFVPTVEVKPESTAYVIYTSGSTGEPKGVEITSENLISSTNARLEFYREPVDRFLLLSPVSFDSSVAGIYWTLFQGGTLVLPPRGCALEPRSLVSLIQDAGITHTLCIPSLYSWLLKASGGSELSSLKVVIVAGEACTRSVSELHFQKNPGARLFNEYGPTEATVWSTVYEASPEERAPSLPIGRPIKGTEILILDANLRPVPAGVPGELYISGNGLAKGYLNAEALTAERFITSPLDGRRLYKTGDAACMLPTGEIKFVGRLDSQVKLNGYRVELGEIEAALLDHPLVIQAAVKAEVGKQTRLVAFYVAEADAKKDLQDVLRASLNQHLPSYMVPSQFVRCDMFPVLPNGKVDREALTVPRGCPTSRTLASRLSSTRARRLLSIWEDVLGTEVQKEDDSFFDLGGNSLQVLEMLWKVGQTFGVNVTPGAFYQTPTFVALAEQLTRQTNVQWRYSTLVSMRGRGTKVPLFLFHGAEGNVLLYRSLVERLSTSHPVYGFQSLGLHKDGEFPGSLEAMAEVYCDELMAFFPDGPYCLAGYCMGGALAFEVAHILRRHNKRIGFVGLIEPSPPYWPSRRPLFTSVQQPAADLLFHIQNAYCAGSDRRTFISAKLETEINRIKVRASAVKSSVMALIDSGRRESHYRKLLAIRTANEQVHCFHRPTILDEQLVLLLPRVNYPGELGKVDEWHRFSSKEIQVHRLRSYPKGMLNEPFVQEVAHLLEDCLHNMAERMVY